MSKLKVDNLPVMKDVETYHFLYELDNVTTSTLESLGNTIDAIDAEAKLGQTAPNPVLSTLRYFRHEYEEKLRPESERMPPLPIVMGEQ